jgi:hypothetical protein
MSRNAVAPDSAEKIISFFGPHKGQAVDPHSLYLPLVPRAKNYYLPNIQLPIRGVTGNAT